MSYKRIVLGAAAVFVFAGAGVCFAEVITVNWDGSGDYTTIQVAINASSDGDVVIVADGTYTGDGNRDIDFLGKAITVCSENGPENCIIDCQGTEVDQHRGFVITNVSDGEVVIKGLSVINGHINDAGGAVRCLYSSVKVEDCIFSNNNARGGGAISCAKSSVSIEECSFSNNTGSSGGAISFGLSQGEIRGCSFTGNTSEGHGGGVYCSGYSSCIVTNSSFIENTCEWAGGGISGTWPDARISLKDCVLEGNKAEEGGGVYNRGQLTIEDCRIALNEADHQGGGISAGQYSEVRNSVIVSNKTGVFAGGIIAGDVCHISNCLIAGNMSNEYCGGIYVIDMSYCTITNSTICNNRAQINGGGIKGSNETIIKVTNSIIRDNEADMGAQAAMTCICFIDNSNIPTSEGDIETFDNRGSIIWGEGNINADPLFANAGYWEDNGTPDYWEDDTWVEGDYRLLSSSPCIDSGCNDTVMGLERFDIGGQIRLLDGNVDGEAVVDMGAYEFAPEGEAIIATDEERIYFTCYESGDRTGQETLKIYNTGAGLLQWQLEEDCDWLEADSYSGTADANGVEVTFNVDATGLASGVYTCEIQILDEGALNNSAIVTAVLYVVPDDGLWVPFHYETIQAAVDAAADFETVLIADGTYTGGGNRDIYINKPTTIRGATDAEHCIVDVQGADDSRGFYLDGVDPNCVLENLTVTGGRYASPGGAGIYCVGSAIIRDCAITNNAMFNGSGGGIRFVGGGRIEGCVIRGNIAESEGGGILCFSPTGGTLEIVGSVIADNMLTYYETHGGGICSYGIDITVADSRITRNGGGRFGGGIYAVNGSNVTVNDSVISNNSASCGGGIYCSNGCNLEMTGCTVEGNTDIGVFVNVDCSAEIVGCEISGNETMGLWARCDLILEDSIIMGNGSGVSCGVGSALISRCTIEDHINDDYYVSDGGGINCSGNTDVEIVGCSIRGNGGDYLFTGGIYADTSQSVTVQNCIVSSNGGSSVGGICLLGNENNVVRNCTVVGNLAWWEGTITPGGILIGGYYDPFPYPYGLVPCGYALVENCIVRDNRGSLSSSFDYNLAVGGEASEILYNNINGRWRGYGVNIGNIDIDPEFVEAGYWDPNGTPEDIIDDFWVEGDYHLQWDSPCVDAGNPYFIAEPGATDVEGNPRVLDGDNDGDAIVDMGAYERYPHEEPVLVVSEDQMSFKCIVGGAEVKEDTFEIRNQGSGTLQWQITENCAWLEANPDSGSLTSGSDEVTLSVDASGLELGTYNCQLEVSAVGAVNSPQVMDVTLYVVRYLVVPLDYATIQAAIDAADDFDVVIVLDGVYTGDGNRDVSFGGKAITVRSENGPEGCIIDCEGTEVEPHRGFKFISGEDENSLLDGFTITNGYGPDEDPEGDSYYYSMAGAVYCKGGSPAIKGCVFAGNTAGHGGAVYFYEGGPTIANCTFNDNAALSSAGAAHLVGTEVVFEDCVFNNNRAEGGRGGAVLIRSYSNVSVAGCSFRGNEAYYNGGGLCCHAESDLTVTNCVFAGNTADNDGGGLHLAGGYEIINTVHIASTTFSGNDPDGIYADTYGWLTVVNSVLWGDLGGEIANPYCAVLSYCDVKGGWGDEDDEKGYGNIDVDPNFVDTSSIDPADWDLHLMPFSPCIDAGQTGYVLPDTADIDGEPRVMAGRVDMGADEVGPKQADFTRDGRIDISDLSVLSGSWDTQEGELRWYVLSDLFEDGVIGLDDLAMFVEDWMWVREE